MHNDSMSTRATVTLSETAQRLVTEYAESRRVSISRAVSDLIERSEPRKPRIKMMNGLAVFDVKLEGGTLTTEQILELEDQPW